MSFLSGASLVGFPISDFPLGVAKIDSTLHPVDSRASLTTDPGAWNPAVLRRDTDYSAPSTSLTIRRNKASGKATITIDPKGKVGLIALKGAQRKVLKGIDLNLDGDMSDSLALVKYPLARVLRGPTALLSSPKKV